MNKGFKNYTKRITQAVGSVAEVSVNVNKEDSNLHIVMPLVSTISRCPMPTSLIFDLQSKDSNFGFGKGVRLNYYSHIEEIADGFQITNSDGSIDKYMKSNNFFNIESGLTLKKTNCDEYGIAYHYEATDAQDNYIEFHTGRNYPKLIKKANGDKISLDFISATKVISNSCGEYVSFNGSKNVTKVESYFDEELVERAVISYDDNDYIKNITYYNDNNVVVKRLSLAISENEIVVKDEISGYRVCYTLSEGCITNIKDGYDDSYTRGNEINIVTIDGRATICNQDGKKNYVVFDNDNYPLYEIDDTGNVVEYTFNKEFNQMTFKSRPMYTQDVNENIAVGIIPELENVTETEVDIVDELGNKLVGTKAKKYVGKGTITYKIDKSGIATDTLTAMVFGRFVDGSYNERSADVKLALLTDGGPMTGGEASSSIVNVESGDFDVAIVGVTAPKSYTHFKLVINLPEGAAMEIGGIRIIKQECGAFYTYDNQGNVTEAVAGNKSKNVEYDTNRATQSIGVDSSLINHTYDEETKKLSKSTHAYGVTVEYEYNGNNSNNITKTKVSNKSGDVVLETSKTYDRDDRLVSTEEDVNGLCRTYTYNDSRGNLAAVIDSMSVVTNYDYFDNGLIKELKLSDANNLSRSSSATYTYDEKHRINTISLGNGSVYTFEYDDFNNISTISLNDVVVFRYEYDEKNRLIKQHYGVSSDYYEFIYTNSNLVDKIYYVNNEKTLKYIYIYDIINRVSKVTDGLGTTLYEYVYDNDGKLSEIKNATATVKYGYDNLGNVNTKKSTVKSKIIAQSFDTVNRSKGSHPESLLHLDIVNYDDVYFGLFNENSNLKNYSGNILKPIDHNGVTIEPEITMQDYIPCCNVSSTKILSYQFSESNPYNHECGFVAFCFKPSSMRAQYLFSSKNPDGNGGIHVYMGNTGVVYVYVVDMYGETHRITTCTNRVASGKWNYFAMSFMNRDDGLGYLNISDFTINLNGHFDSFVKKNPKIHFDLGSYPVYNIGHNYDGTTASSFFEGTITCLTIGPRDYVSYDYLKKHYASVKDHCINNVFIDNDDGIATVDFSDVNLYTTDSNIQNKFEVYPLNNSVNSINGKSPIVFEHRNIGQADKDRNFNFNTAIKRYAYVADGSDLKYNFGSGASGTVAMRAYIEEYEERQYFFDMKDSNGHTLGLFRSRDFELCVNLNGETIMTPVRLDDKTWTTLALSFSREIVSDSASSVTYMNLRVYVDGEMYYYTPNIDFEYGDLELLVGKSFVADNGSTTLVDNYKYAPLKGQIEMLATSDAFCEDATINTLATELKTYTKVREFDDIGMLRKTEIHCAGTPIIADLITYKKNGDKTTMCVDSEKFTYEDGSTRERSYETDLYGRVTAVSDTVLGNHTYEYDYRGFLVREDEKTFAYDGNGNITKCGDTVFTYDNVIKDRLMSVGGKAITYSETNPLNPKTYDGKTFEFEGRRLVKVTSDEMVATYKYDDRGLRIRKTVTENGVTTTTNFVYDNGKLITEYTDSSRVDYLYDETDMLYGFIYEGAKHFYIRDTLLNILGIVDAYGTPVVQYDYSAYGQCNAVTGTMADTVGAVNSFKYKGYYFDKETDFFYCKSRYYSAEFCRFISPDSADCLDTSSVVGMNLYAYCSNDPINKYDPTGNFPWLILAVALLFTPVGGTTLQIATSVLSYAGMAVASIFDEDIRNDMDAIGWNPFNTDESTTLNSNKVSFYKGVPVFRTAAGGRSGSFGAIFLTKRSGVDTLRHERGHNWQLMMMGIGTYGFTVGIPSPLILGPWGKAGNYYGAPWETMADILGGVSGRVHSSTEVCNAWRYYAVSTLCFPFTALYWF